MIEPGKWKKASFSNGTGGSNCVEVLALAGGVFVRDSNAATNSSRTRHRDTHARVRLSWPCPGRHVHVRTAAPVMTARNRSTSSRSMRLTSFVASYRRC